MQGVYGQRLGIPFVQIGNRGVVRILVGVVRRDVVPFEVGRRGVPGVGVAFEVVLGVIDDDERLARLHRHVAAAAGDAVEGRSGAALRAEVAAGDHLGILTRVEGAREDQHHAVGVECLVGVVADLEVLVAMVLVGRSGLGQRRAGEVDLLDDELTGAYGDVALLDCDRGQQVAAAAARNGYRGLPLGSGLVAGNLQHECRTCRFGFVDPDPRGGIGRNRHVEIRGG